MALRSIHAFQMLQNMMAALLATARKALLLNLTEQHEKNETKVRVTASQEQC